ncbi:MAG TPA: isochorismatase family protein [Steroidobacteraceae bacterium]|nr:isochorismatase family protein [Steroidobacteraceae bacterium]
MNATRDARGPRAPEDALLAVDVQNDFLPGGALAVPHGDAVLRPLNAWLRVFDDRGCLTAASRDWHPAGHCSFAARGGPWPAHCVAGSAGAAFAAGLELPARCRIIDKGTCADREAYSAFAGTTLAAELAAAGVRRLWLGGLATDYCVAATARDALALGLEVVVLCDAVRAVDATAGDGARALAALAAEGAALRAGGPGERRP